MECALASNDTYFLLKVDKPLDCERTIAQVKA